MNNAVSKEQRDLLFNIEGQTHRWLQKNATIPRLFPDLYVVQMTNSNANKI